jgi:hypothetical protein
MITLEEQIRRYATDVAGPAAGEPPTDLFDLGRPRHRGRWLLVAALAVFVAGISWIAVRPGEHGQTPSVDTVAPTPPTTLLAVRSGPAGSGPCSADGSASGTMLEGPDGEGLCVYAGDLAGDMALLRIFSEGTELVRIRLSPCSDSEAVGYPPFTVELPDGPILSIGFLPPESTYGQVVSDPTRPRLAAFDLIALPDTRIVVSRVATGSTASSIRPLDANGIELQNYSLASAPTCVANDGTPTVTTLP